MTTPQPQQKAIFGYHASNNLGDAVQSYALLALLDSPPTITVVDRDDIGSFAPDEDTLLIMNGWLLHRPERFLLAPRVTPAMIGVHITPCQPSYSRYPSFERIVRNCPSIRSVFMRSSPVGARDLFTLSALKDAGIDAYFCGCPTLTLQPRGISKSNEIIAVDVPRDICDAIGTKVGDRVNQITANSDHSWHTVESLQTSVEPYLSRLEGARLVITTRLHAALPALAMGSHVIFCPEDISDPRFSGLIDFLPFTVPLNSMKRLPKSAFESQPWTPALDHRAQAQIIRRAVAKAVGGISQTTLHDAPVTREGLLLDLERAALVQERIKLRQSCSWRGIAWARRVRAAIRSGKIQSR